MPKVEPFGISVGPDCGFQLSGSLLSRVIEQGALSAFLFSNPCNPTGQLADDEALQEIVDVSRGLDCALQRDLIFDGLRQIGVRVPAEPKATFYVWGDLCDLPPPLNDGGRLFQAALEQRVVVVPGHFFDVNPCQDQRRDAGYRGWARFSFGPAEECLRLGLRRLTELIAGRRARM